jgi:hypothetical protein
MVEPANLLMPETHKDRRAGLIAFGILEILLGFLCVLIMIGVFVVAILLPQIDETLNRQAIITSLAFYGLAAVALIWLGIGSILCRRWACVLLLIGSWSALFGGIMVLVVYGLFAKELFAGIARDGAATFALVVSILFIAVFLIILPGSMVLFYGSSNVKATCLARHPRPCWTDGCPMPVLATSLWLLIGTISMLLIPIFYRSVMPCFGMLLVGIPATLVFVIFAVLGIYLAWGTYRLKLTAWWLSLIATTLLCLSAAVTFLRIDLFEYYRELGYPEQAIEQLRNFKFFSGTNVILWIVVSYVLLLIYWIWIRKYFRTEIQNPDAGAAGLRFDGDQENPANH